MAVFVLLSGQTNLHSLEDHTWAALRPRYILVNHFCFLDVLECGRITRYLVGPTQKSQYHTQGIVSCGASFVIKFCSLKEENVVVFASF